MRYFIKRHAALSTIVHAKLYKTDLVRSLVLKVRVVYDSELLPHHILPQYLKKQTELLLFLYFMVSVGSGGHFDLY